MVGRPVQPFLISASPDHLITHWRAALTELFFAMALGITLLVFHLGLLAPPLYH